MKPFTSAEVEDFDFGRREQELEWTQQGLQAWSGSSHLLFASTLSPSGTGGWPFESASYGEAIAATAAGG